METNDSIKSKRINGYLDLNSYFIKRLGRPFKDKEDLYANGLIEIESIGRSEKFWILDENGDALALFKEPIDPRADEQYAELISEEVAKVLEMPTAHYDLATFDGAHGVISYNFVDKYDAYLAGFDILMNFYEDKLEEDKEMCDLYNIDFINDTIDDVFVKLNNLEDVWTILEDRYKGHPNKQYIVSKIVDGLVNKLIFDILMVNVDDHVDNWGELDSLEHGKMTAPQFDNSRVINLHRNILVEKFVRESPIEEKNLNFIVSNNGIRKPLEVLNYFLDVSSSEYLDMVKEKVNKLYDNIEHIPFRIEERTEYPMPDYLRRYFCTTMYEHLDKVNEVIESKEKKRK